MKAETHSIPNRLPKRPIIKTRKQIPTQEYHKVVVVLADDTHHYHLILSTPENDAAIKILEEIFNDNGVEYEDEEGTMEFYPKANLFTHIKSISDSENRSIINIYKETMGLSFLKNHLECHRHKCGEGPGSEKQFHWVFSDKGSDSENFYEFCFIDYR